MRHSSGDPGYIHCREGATLERQPVCPHSSWWMHRTMRVAGTCAHLGGAISLSCGQRGDRVLWRPLGSHQDGRWELHLQACLLVALSPVRTSPHTVFQGLIFSLNIKSILKKKWCLITKVPSPPLCIYWDDNGTIAC